MKQLVHGKRNTWVALVTALLLAFVLVGSSVLAQDQGRGVVGDNNPAITVAQSTASSVVGVITNTTTWNRQQGETNTPLAQGSGVVIQAGYVLTNYHVVEEGNSFEVVLPSGETASAELVGGDASTDLAVLKVDSNELVPVTIGVSNDLLVGSTAIAIGNPGGTVLANTVTSGIVSALERTSIQGSRSSRAISYIQHDAAINSGNSGGGLFNINGELVGINTLKYYGSMFSGSTYEGLGFAIPIDTAYPIAMDLIEHGKVLRPQMGVTVSTVEGPDQAINSYPPASVCIVSVNEGSPAAVAGLNQYDFITEINGERVLTLQELTSKLDLHNAGDSVSITVVRYSNPEGLLSSMGYFNNGTSNSEYYNPFGNYGFGGNYGNQQQGSFTSTYETLTFDVTLEILD